jgi:hypothetical protein
MNRLPIAVLSLLLLAGGEAQARKPLRGPLKKTVQRAKRFTKNQLTRATLGARERRCFRAITRSQPRLRDHYALTARVNGGVVPNYKKGRILTLEWAARPDVKDGKLQRTYARPSYRPGSREARLIARLDKMNAVLWSDKAKNAEPAGEGINVAGDKGVWRQVLRARRWTNLAINQLVQQGDLAAAQKTYRQAQRELTVFRSMQRRGTLDLGAPLRILGAVYAATLE